jgi:hypothetical protein
MHYSSMKLDNKPLALLASIALTAFGSTLTLAAPPPPNAVRVRGTVQSLTAQVLTVVTVNGSVRVQISKPLSVLSVVPSSRSLIKPGSFLGIASVTQPNGTQRAAEIVVFPEAARGAGEGNYAWDLPAAGKVHSKMTNGTVAAPKAMHSRMTNGTVSSQAGSSALTLQYKTGTGTGSQTLTLPPNIPVVTFVPGQLGQLTLGAHVLVNALRKPNGTLTANRVLVGKNGLVPPM